MMDKLVAATDHAFDGNGGVFTGVPNYKIAADRSQGGAFLPVARCWIGRQGRKIQVGRRQPLQAAEPAFPTVSPAIG